MEKKILNREEMKNVLGGVIAPPSDTDSGQGMYLCKLGNGDNKFFVVNSLREAQDDCATFAQQRCSAPHRCFLFL